MKITFLAFSFCLFPLSISASTYYVSPTGNDAHTCIQAQSAASPKQTIQAGFRCTTPGDTVLVSAGTYVESVVLNKSGQENRPITLKATPGETVIWRSQNTDPNSEKGAITISQQSFLRIEGFTFDGSLTRSTILVRNTPRRKEILPVQGIEIIDNTFTNNGQATNEARVIYFISTGHKTFDSGDVPNVISGNSFSGNYGRSISLLASSDTVVRNNTCTDQKGSLRPQGSYSARFIQIDGESNNDNGARNIVERNTVHDFVIQPYAENAAHALEAIKLDVNTDQNIIRNNLIYNIDIAEQKSSQGISIESRCDDNLIFGNIVYNVGGSCYRDGSKTTSVTVGNQWLNNVAYKCKCGLSFSNTQNAVIKNNIFAQSGSAQVYINDVSVTNSGHMFSNNLYYNPEGENLNTWNGTAASCQEATHDFSAWVSSSNDMNSLSADPHFVDPPLDFRLRSTSPAISAGVAGVNLGAYPTVGDGVASPPLSAPVELLITQ